LIVSLTLLAGLTSIADKATTPTTAVYVFYNASNTMQRQLTLIATVAQLGNDSVR